VHLTASPRHRTWRGSAAVVVAGLTFAACSSDAKPAAGPCDFASTEIVHAALARADLARRDLGKDPTLRTQCGALFGIPGGEIVVTVERYAAGASVARLRTQRPDPHTVVAVSGLGRGAFLDDNRFVAFAAGGAVVSVESAFGATAPTLTRDQVLALAARLRHELG
jgi:hypothetical protein